jgi:hypothetical protein
MTAAGYFAAETEQTAKIFLYLLEGNLLFRELRLQRRGLCKQWERLVVTWWL